MEEEWRYIPGYEGLYEVSNMGRCRSLDRVRRCSYGTSRAIKGMLLKERLNTDGYPHMTLYNNAKRQQICFHKAVMLAFVGPSHLVIDHKNGIKTDNRLENLEYVTNHENIVRYHRERKSAVGVFRDKRRNKWVARITINGKFHSSPQFDEKDDAIKWREEKYALAQEVQKNSRQFMARPVIDRKKYREDCAKAIEVFRSLNVEMNPKLKRDILFLAQRGLKSVPPRKFYETPTKESA